MKNEKKYAKLSPNPNDEGHVAWALTGKASAEISNGLFSDAKKHLSEAQEIYDRIVALNFDEHYWALGRLHAYYGDWYRNQSKNEKAEKEYVKAMSIFKEYIDVRPAEYLLSVKYTYGSMMSWIVQTIVTLAKNNEFDEIKNLVDVLYPYYEKIPYKDAKFKEETAEKMGDISDYLIHFGLFEEAENTAKYALSIDNRKQWIKTNLAAALLFQGKFSEAETIYRQYKAQFKKEMLDDLESFAANGIIPKEREADVEKIKIMLNEK